jgi:predicted NBD/HSP70 family sugar kinase
MPPPEATVAPPVIDDSLAVVLRLIRTGGAVTRPDLARATGLGRTFVSARLDELIGTGLVREGPPGRSSGGRAPRILSFEHDAGRILTALVGDARLSVAVTDLNGAILASRSTKYATVPDAPETLAMIGEHAARLLASHGDAPVWGIGLGTPGAGAARSAMREGLAARFAAPAWADSILALETLGELRTDETARAREALYISVGSDVRVGIIADGRLHRGSTGAAGRIPHLDAVVGVPAIVARATEAARAGESPALAEQLGRHGAVRAKDVVAAAQQSDPLAIELLTESAVALGEALAVIADFYNPSLVVVGGELTHGGDFYLATIRGIVFRRALPQASRTLRIAPAGLGKLAALRGGAVLVTDELFTSRELGARISRPAPG